MRAISRNLPTVAALKGAIGVLLSVAGILG
jgi:hypothetical protein